MKVFRLSALLIALVLVVTACGGGGGGSGSPAASPGGEGEIPDKLIIGFVPSREAGALVEDIQPLVDFVSEELDMPVEGYVSTDYTGLVTAMETGQAHVGAFGPFSLLQARDRAGAEIILQSERFGAATYHTQYFTNDPDKYCDDEPVENEDGFLNCNGTADAEQGPVAEEKLALIEPGTTVSFVEQSSTSGYIFPAVAMREHGIDHEADIEPSFATSHENTIVEVCDGDAEVGVSFDDARGAAVESGTECDVASTVVVFALGKEIPNDGWAVAGDLPDDFKERIKQALLDYAATEEGKAVLEEIYEIDNLVEADEDAFIVVEEAAEELGITEDPG